MVSPQNRAHWGFEDDILIVLSEEKKKQVLPIYCLERWGPFSYDGGGGGEGSIKMQPYANSGSGLSHQCECSHINSFNSAPPP